MPRPLVRVEVLREAAGMRVDRFLREKLPSVPHSLLCKLMRKRAIVKLDGERRVRLEPNTRLAAGDVLGVTDSLAASKEPLSTSKETLAPRPEAAVSKRHVEALRAALLRETPNYLVFNKPARLPVQGGERIAQHVAALLPHLPLPDAAELRTVHRLDSGTTGVLVVARSRAAARELCGLFLEHKVSKRYLALAYGELRDARGSVSAPLQPVFVFGKGQRMQLVAPQGGGFTSPMTQARAADTRYRLLAEGSDGDERFSLVELAAISGRKHQLRVHMASVLQAPIYGDNKYGRIDPNRPRELLHLHCHRLSFEDPFDGGRRVEFEAPLPPHILATLKRVGIDVSRALAEAGGAL